MRVCLFADPSELSYAPTIFASLGLNASTTSLLATGVLGIVDFIFTSPPMFFVDKWGRRTFLMAGALGMAVSHIIVAGILGHYGSNFNQAGGKAAGWVGIVFIWVRQPAAITTTFRCFPGSAEEKGLTRNAKYRSSEPTFHTLGDRLPGCCLLSSFPPAIAARRLASTSAATT
jgi:MFS family permease